MASSAGMHSRASKKKRQGQSDINQLAVSIVEQATAMPELTPDGKNAAAVALSKLGASKGGEARAKKLSKKRRAEIARKAAKARWGKPKK